MSLKNFIENLRNKCLFSINELISQHSKALKISKRSLELLYIYLSSNKNRKLFYKPQKGMKCKSWWDEGLQYLLDKMKIL